MSTVCR